MATRRTRRRRGLARRAPRLACRSTFAPCRVGTSRSSGRRSRGSPMPSATCGRSSTRASARRTRRSGSSSTRTKSSSTRHSWTAQGRTSDARRQSTRRALRSSRSELRPSPPRSTSWSLGASGGGDKERLVASVQARASPCAPDVAAESRAHPAACPQSTVARALRDARGGSYRRATRRCATRCTSWTRSSLARGRRCTAASGTSRTRDSARWSVEARSFRSCLVSPGGLSVVFWSICFLSSFL
ncbi:hypothetical protein DMC30DRAFT_398228 [Rhodotorula diobovata]|uniref:Uncharacterized protein n=1 Tax=Rhodotorula diobovata TaxID=5288 RepID=A0A5C5FWY4_9BASI|nr:hypothetical protein DMC30DRAFT_398228 [Rhodotorula diobovata]